MNFKEFLTTMHDAMMPKRIGTLSEWWNYDGTIVERDGEIAVIKTRRNIEILSLLHYVIPLSRCIIAFSLSYLRFFTIAPPRYKIVVSYFHHRTTTSSRSILSRLGHRIIMFSPVPYHHNVTMVRTITISQRSVPLQFHHSPITFSRSNHKILTTNYRVFIIIHSRFHSHAIMFSPLH